MRSANKYDVGFSWHKYGVMHIRGYQERQSTKKSVNNPETQDEKTKPVPVCEALPNIAGLTVQEYLVNTIRVLGVFIDH